jgi:arthrofactin-type cyclic lipopeptide synthetase C
MEMMCKRAIADYVVYPLPIPVHLFTARDEPPVDRGGAVSRLLTGWRSSVPRQSVRISEAPSRPPFVTGTHVSACGPLVSKALASAALEKTELPESRYQAALAIQIGKDGNPPIFCVPGAGDNVISFMDLVHVLGREWSVYGLQPRGVENGLVPHSTVEAAACVYLKAIDAVHPRGPLHLIGHSFGGWVVLEMALRMRMIGRPVASLTVIDSDAPGRDTLMHTDHTSIEVMSALIESMELSAGRSLGIDLGVFASRSRTEQMRILHTATQDAGLLPRHAKPEVLLGPSRTFGTALRTPYVPQAVYSGLLRLVLARDPRRDEQDNRRVHEEAVRGWRAWASAMTRWYSAGNHFTVLKKPHVNALADWWMGQ